MTVLSQTWLAVLLTVQSRIARYHTKAAVNKPFVGPCCPQPTEDTAAAYIMAYASTSGYSIPSMVIFDCKHLQLEMTMGEVPGTSYSLSNNGWMNAELFQEWFQNHFLVHAPSCQPLLLLLDGHSSNYYLSTIRMAADEKVILFCLLPHTTHLLQPLDNGTFSLLKAN